MGCTINRLIFYVGVAGFEPATFPYAYGTRDMEESFISFRILALMCIFPISFF